MNLAAVVNYFPNAAAEAQTAKPCKEQKGGEHVLGTNCQTAVVQNGGNDSGIDIGGTPSEGVTTEPDTAQFQINTKGSATTQGAAPANGGDTVAVGASKPIESTQNGPDLGV